MDARCYDGKFALYGESRAVEVLPLVVVVVFLSLSSLVVIFSKDLALI
jgi:hypothetical protein